MKFPEFDEALKQAAAPHDIKEPRQDHIINTLAQVTPIVSFQVTAGQLQNFDKAAYPGYLELLAGQARSVRIVADAMDIFLQNVAEHLTGSQPE